jgi:hypothetical protein
LISYPKDAKKMLEVADFASQQTESTPECASICHKLPQKGIKLRPKMRQSPPKAQ